LCTPDWLKRTSIQHDGCSGNNAIRWIPHGSAVADGAERGDAIDGVVAGDQLKAHRQRSPAGPGELVDSAAATPGLAQNNKPELLDSLLRRVVIKGSHNACFKPAFRHRIAHETHRPIDPEPCPRSSLFDRQRQFARLE